MSAPAPDYAQRAVATDPPKAESSDRPRAPLRKPQIVRRLEAQRVRHRQRPIVVRVLYILVGFTLLLSGVGMLVLPGPAFLVIPVGLAILSLEFVWAEGLLDRALEKGEIARQKAAETTRTQRLLSAVACALGAAALAAWALLADIPLVPV
jgi:uncharacterized protein (TIGR02611 family)